MTRLAKSTHVVLREGAANLRNHGAPVYMVDRMAILSEVAEQNRRDAQRLISAVLDGLPEEVALLGNGDPIPGVRL